MLHTILLAILMLVILGTGIVAVIIPDLFSSVVLFGAFSFFVVLAYLMLSAPDVAFTEVVISVVSTAYFVTAIREFRKGEGK